MALKKPESTEELKQNPQADQPDDAKKTRAKSKSAPKKPQSGTKAKVSKKTAEETGTVAPKAKTLSQSVPGEEPVVAIGDRREAETESDKAKSDLLDLLESYKAGRVLTDHIEGVEKIKGTVAAVLYHGSFKVIIPAEEAINPPNDYRGNNPTAVHRYMLAK